jgi:hypothetical protein
LFRATGDVVSAQNGQPGNNKVRALLCGHFEGLEIKLQGFGPLTLWIKCGKQAAAHNIAGQH